MNLVQPGKDTIKFMTSAEPNTEDSADLLSVAYTRAQRESPEFLTVYEGIEQSVCLCERHDCLLRADMSPELYTGNGGSKRMLLFGPRASGETLRSSIRLATRREMMPAELKTGAKAQSSGDSMQPVKNAESVMSVSRAKE